MKKKKLVIFHHFGGLGGAGLSLIHIVKSINRSKFDIVIVCPAAPNEMVGILEKLNFTIEKTEQTPVIFNHYNGGIKHFLSPRTFLNLIKILNDIKRVKAILLKHEADIVMLNSMTLFWIGFILKKFNVTKIIFHRETYGEGMFGFRKKIIKWGLNNLFNKVVYISNYDLNITKSNTNIRDNVTHTVIYDKVEVDKYQKLDQKEARNILGLEESGSIKYILYLGGFSKLKGYNTIFDILPRLKEDQKILFVGNLPKFNLRNIHKLMKIKHIKKKYSNNILFLSPSSQPEVFYKASDLIIFPSSLPHQSRPIYEAGLAKIPIIISDFEQTSEFIIHDNTGFTFNINKLNELESLIQYILNEKNKNHINKIIESNYFNSLDNHNFNTLINEINILLNKE